MKRIKKLLVLVLAMMMAFSIMAVTAAAAGSEEDGIMPLGQSYRCLQCGNGTVSSYFARESVTVYKSCSACSYIMCGHTELSTKHATIAATINHSINPKSCLVMFVTISMCAEGKLLFVQ